MKYRILRGLLFAATLMLYSHGFSQPIDIDYSNPKKFTIADIQVESDRPINRPLVISLSGLEVGKTIEVPGQDLKTAIENLWKQKLFSDIEIAANKVEGDNIYLLIKVITRPRLSNHLITGVGKAETKTLDDKLKLNKGDVVSEHYLKRIENTISNYYTEKGFANTTVTITRSEDTLYNKNSNRLKIHIDKGQRIRIDKIDIEGNAVYSDFRIKMLLKKTKQHTWQYWLRSSKFNRELYEEDKNAVAAFYQSKGYRDAGIAHDTILTTPDGNLYVKLTIDEGNLYYFRNITFSGNTKYPSNFLNAILNINKGDAYDPVKLERNLRMNPNGLDVTTLYMDNGYLFFNLMPVESAIGNDSIDLEIRIYEGPQATINRISVSGNDRTNDHVFLRELQTNPGDKFSRSNVIITQQRLAQLGLIDAEAIDIRTNPDPKNGTVDIEYVIAEKPSDQIELSMGYGQRQVVGVLGLTLNNFSSRNLLKTKNWGGPYPMGDGQRLSIRAQSSGVSYQSYNFSFTEPWFGGKKPNSFTISAYHTIFTSGYSTENLGKFKVTGGSLGLGKRLTWPDNYFNMYNALSYRRYGMENYSQIFSLFSNGVANNIYFTHSLSRNSISAPIYPRNGSSLSLSLNWSLPVSLVRNIDYKTALPEVKYKWIEYHKWRFDLDFYMELLPKLVLKTSANFGYLGSYSKEYGTSPFERFFMGGDGISGFNLDARELIRLRGYANNKITPNVKGFDQDGNYTTLLEGGGIFNKYTIELRYPLTLNPQATVYILGFMEAGNNFLNFKDYNPFDLYRSAGAGVRFFLPMFGLIGFDYGFGFDGTVGNERQKGGQFHISIGQQF
ncbi:MAG: outer membrane protein assembly factor BamA [Bacteroidetes bacterium]|nr:outer membrane protein assembly factor BamA [Bacteroidota bacterium]